MDLVRLKLEIAFDGSAYAGWQVQKTGVGVQEKVEEALAHLFPGAKRVCGSSRTDTGVHARGMVAHVDIPAEQVRIPAGRLPLALNRWLPDDVRVLKAGLAPEGFHAQYDAQSKEYRYRIWNHTAMNPLRRHDTWHVPRKLDLEAMKAAAQHFVGQHNFRAFAGNPGYGRASYVRTVFLCEVRGRKPDLTLRIEGDGFLYRMCRNIAGTIAYVGEGKLDPGEIPRILTSRDRRLAGVTAPPHGLVLWRVKY